MEGDQHVNEDLYIGEDKNNGSSGEVRESDEDGPNCDHAVSRRASTATF